MMKMIAILALIGATVCGVFADDRFVEHAYGKKSFRDAFLGIVSISISDNIQLHFKGNREDVDQKKMLYGKLAGNLPRVFKETSSCARIEICSTAVLESMSPHRLDLGHGSGITINIPSRMVFPGKKDAKPKYGLFLEITKSYVDSSTFTVDPGAMLLAGTPHERIVEDIPFEECLNFVCNYAFIDCGNGALVCFGHVTAEGCGKSSDRYGRLGVWDASIKDLAGEIVEDSPFEMKTLDASDFH
jgi:hypothetical protein